MPPPPAFGFICRLLVIGRSVGQVVVVNVGHAVGMSVRWSVGRLACPGLARYDWPTKRWSGVIGSRRVDEVYMIGVESRREWPRYDWFATWKRDLT